MRLHKLPVGARFRYQGNNYIMHSKFETEERGVISMCVCRVTLDGQPTAAAQHSPNNLKENWNIRPETIQLPGKAMTLENADVDS